MRGKSLKIRLSFVLAIMMVAALINFWKEHPEKSLLR